MLKYLKLKLYIDRLMRFKARIYAAFRYFLKRQHIGYEKTVEAFIESPTRRQLSAAHRELSPESLDTYKKYFKLFGLSDGAVLDVGGNIGYTAILFRYLLPAKVQVFTFEPYKPNLPYLIANIQNWGIHLVPFGVGQVSEQLKLSFPTYTKNLKGDNRKSTGRISAVGLSPACEEELSSSNAFSISLDHFKSIFVPQETVRFIKIDIEGYEMNALKGARSLINSDRPVVQMEANPNTMNAANFNFYDLELYCNSLDYCMLVEKRKKKSEVLKGMPKSVMEIFMVHKDEINEEWLRLFEKVELEEFGTEAMPTLSA